jgi:hypothetical protein
MGVANSSIEVAPAEKLCAPQEEGGVSGGRRKVLATVVHLLETTSPVRTPLPAAVAATRKRRFGPLVRAEITMAQALFGLGHDAISLPTSS